MDSDFSPAGRTVAMEMPNVIDAVKNAQCVQMNILKSYDNSCRNDQKSFKKMRKPGYKFQTGFQALGQKSLGLIYFSLKDCWWRVFSKEGRQVGG